MPTAETMIVLGVGSILSLLLAAVGFFLRRVLTGFSAELSNTRKAIHEIKNDFHTWQLSIEREFVRRVEYADMLVEMRRDSEFKREMMLGISRQTSDIAVAVARLEERTKA